MSDYIKREDAINTVSSLVRDEEIFVQEYAIDRIERITSVDVVEVVRCKDCKWYKEYIPRKGESAMMCFCPCSIGGQGKKKPTDYCSYGERKEQNNE